MPNQDLVGIDVAHEDEGPAQHEERDYRNDQGDQDPQRPGAAGESGELRRALNGALVVIGAALRQETKEKKQGSHTRGRPASS